ncbi:phylloplanin-like [Durio zibethinus]|uniref:Phylloplanin-like n=1 Tax=Durio zibethinus TaxID=66656 RepID=A0A6P6A8T0_DURZI|nr:phylloplanin-like [Durio zibethinus]
MALKTLVFVCFLVAAMALVVPMAEAQFGGLIGNLLGLIRVTGTVFCTADGNMGENGTATPVFPNALVQLQCGGNVVFSATTNGSGIFSILLDPLQFLLPSLLNNCNLAVKTPLSNCNATLPSVGGLFSSLQVLGNTLVGLLNIANIIPTRFRLLP